MPAFLKELRDGVLHLLYPRLCEGCSKPLLAVERVLCIGCGMLIPQTQYHDEPDNQTALCFAGRFPFYRATSYAYFAQEGLLQHLVHGLKYHDKQEIGLYLGNGLGHALRDTGWIKEVDMIVPVPLHRAKLAKRGYNQSLLIAEGMSDALDIPVATDVLHRLVDTESQTRKTRMERVDNMAGAFGLKHEAKVAGRHVLLCDDVLTTGATIEACALALMAAGNVKISVATIGIAVA